MFPKRVILLGATGSIGKSTLDVASSRPDLFRIVAMSAHTGEASLLKAQEAYAPGSKLCLSGASPASGRIEYPGPDGLERMIAEVSADIVLNGIAGAAGLDSSITAIENGKDLALANKETMVLAGRLVLEAASRADIRVLPVDSEHAAVFQLVQRFGSADLDEIILTASGGAFRNHALQDLGSVTPEDASKHPNWSMGRKITIDSASMANKGLEIIEAVRFFGVDSSRVRVLIHPQSQVHALIRMRDGSLYSQMSGTDMRIAIQQALTWPKTESCAFARLDLAGRTLSFSEPDMERYPLLNLAYFAVEAGEGYTIAYNAANEAAVQFFVERRIGFLDISRVVRKVLDAEWPSRVDDISQVHSLDAKARILAEESAKGI